jgi:Skp family chaperone for outer membrane proteins
MWAVALAGTLLAVAAPMGCKPETGSMGGSSHGDSGATAVVNMDKVATDLGWMTKMESNLNAYKEQLQKDAKQFQDTYNQQINNIAQTKRPRDLDPKANYTLSPSDSQEIQQYLMVERQTLQQISQEAEQAFNVYRAKWIKQYRDALSPVVRQVASDKKATVVIQAGDNVLYTDRSVDLTDAVVDAAKSKPPTLTEIEMTHLQGPSALQIDQRAVSQPAATQPAPTQPAKSPE